MPSHLTMFRLSYLSDFVLSDIFFHFNVRQINLAGAYTLSGICSINFVSPRNKRPCRAKCHKLSAVASSSILVSTLRFYSSFLHIT